MVDVGSRVRVPENPLYGIAVVRYLGPVSGTSGTFVGVELGSPVGKNDGVAFGTRYFTCPPNYGLFLPIQKVSLAEDPPTSAARAASTATVSVPSSRAPSTPSLAPPAQAPASAALAELEELRSWRSKATEKLVAQKAQIAELQAALDADAEQSAAALRDAAENARKVIALETENAAVRREISDRRAAANADAESSRRSDREAAERERAGLEEQLAGLRAKADEAGRRAASAASQHEECARALRQQVSELEDSNARLRSRVEDLLAVEVTGGLAASNAVGEQEHRSVVEKQISHLESLLETARGDQRKASEAASSAMEAFESSEERVRSAESALSLAQLRTQKLETELGKLRDEFSSAAQSAADLRRERDALDAEVAALRSQIALLREDSSRVAAEGSGARAQVAAELDSQRHRLLAAEEANQALRRELLDLQQSESRLRQERDDSAASADEQGRQLALIKERLETHLAERRTEISASDLETRKLRQQLADAQIELKAGALHTERVLERERENIRRSEQDRSASIEERVRELSDQLEELESSLESVTLDKEIAEERVEALEEEVAGLRASLLARVPSSVADSGADHLHSAREIELSAQNERLRAGLMKLKELSVAEKKQHEDMMSDLMKENATLPRLHEKIDQLRRELAAGVEERTRLQSALDEAMESETMVAKLSQRVLDLEEELLDVRTTVDELEQLREVHEQIEERQSEQEKAARAQLQRREVALLDAHARMQRLQTELADREATLATFRSRLAGLQDDLKESRDRGSAETSAAGAAAARMQRVEARMLGLERQLSRARAGDFDRRLELAGVSAQQREHEWLRARAIPAAPAAAAAVDSLLMLWRLFDRLVLLATVLRERLAIDDLLFRLTQRVPLELDILGVPEGGAGDSMSAADALVAADFAFRLWSGIVHAAHSTRRFLDGCGSFTDADHLPLVVDAIQRLLPLESFISTLTASLREEHISTSLDLSPLVQHTEAVATALVPGASTDLPRLALDASSVEHADGASSSPAEAVARMSVWRMLELESLEVVAVTGRCGVKVRQIVDDYLDGVDDVWADRPSSYLQALADAASRLAAEASTQPLALPTHFMRSVVAKVSAVRDAVTALLVWLADVHGELAVVRELHGAVSQGALMASAARTPRRWSAPPEVASEATDFARWCTSEIAAASARLAAQDAERLQARDHDRMLSFAEPTSVWCKVAGAARRELDDSHRAHADLQALRAEVSSLRAASEFSERELRELARKEKVVLSQLQVAHQREESTRQGAETERAELSDQLRQHREALEKLELENSQLLMSHADMEARLAAAPYLNASATMVAPSTSTNATTARALRSAQQAFSHERCASLRRVVALWTPLAFSPQLPHDRKFAAVDLTLRKTQASLRVIDSRSVPGNPCLRDSMLSIARREFEIRSMLAELEAAMW